MKIYRNVITLLLLMLVCFALTASTAIADSGMSKAQMYEEGLKNLEVENYEAAIDLFTRLGTYEQSTDYKMFSYALLYLKEERYAEAITYFDILAASEFEDCGKYSIYSKGRKAEAEADAEYAKGRVAEAENSVKKAIGFYRGLGFLDSNERLLLLYKVLPPELPTPEPAPPMEPIQLNDKGRAVMDMQALLIHKNYLYQSVSGIFDAHTKDAVENVQKDYDLPITGIYDEATKNVLTECIARPFAVPFNTPYIIYENYELTKNGDIFSLKIWVKNISGNTIEKTHLKFESIDSARNIISTQNHTEEYINSGETRGGILDLKDISFYGAIEININILSVEYRDNQAIDINDGVIIIIPVDLRIEPTPSPTPEPTPMPTPPPKPVPKPLIYETLQKGSRGEDVRKLQERLSELEYPVGKADGIYGNMTADAVSYFQAASGLPVTGIADHETQVRLFAKDAVKRRDAVIPYTSLRFIDTEITLNRGGSKQIEIYVYPYYATYGLKWKSNDPSIATVNKQGIVTGVSAGTAIITATDESTGLRLTCTVRVTAPSPGKTKKPNSNSDSNEGSIRF